jgi:hypothetical protein
MANQASDSDRRALRLDFDHHLMLQVRGSVITSDAGLLAYRELDETLGLTDTGADVLADTRTGRTAATYGQRGPRGARWGNEASDRKKSSASERPEKFSPSVGKSKECANIGMARNPGQEHPHAGTRAATA